MFCVGARPGQPIAKGAVGSAGPNSGTAAGTASSHMWSMAHDEPLHRQILAEDFNSVA